jgi:hypothetical protein
MLLRSAQGEPQVWQVVQVLSVAAEEQRHLHRDLATLQRERARTTARLNGVRSRQGLPVTSVTKRPAPREALRRWEGSPMPPGLRQRGLRVSAQPQGLREQRAAVEAERRAWLHDATDARLDKLRQCMRRKGMGSNGSGVFGMAVCGWRACTHRRAVGGLAGCTPTP